MMAREMSLAVAQEHHRKGRLAEAERVCQELLRRKAQDALTWCQLGMVRHDQDRFDEAVDCYRRAIALAPRLREAHNNLGNSYWRKRQFSEAMDSFRRAIEIDPAYIKAYVNLGNLQREVGHLDDAIASFMTALRSEPNTPGIHVNLGNIYQLQKKLEDAAACYERAIELDPGFGAVHNNLGNVFRAQGKNERASACYRTAVELDPTLSEAHSNLVFAEQYIPGVTAAHLAKLHADWNERHGVPLKAKWRPPAVDPDPGRPLHLGFVSADLGRHPVGWFMVRMLENLDRRQFRVSVYSDRLLTDPLAQRLRRFTDAWSDVYYTSHEELAKRLHADHIDILFDLSGHTARNRLIVFARKPAPIQITWMGYVGTTGLEAMDFLIGDRFQVPQEMEPHLKEKVIRMPDGYICYEPPEYAPDVGPLPAIQRGQVTFGCFNNPAKVTEGVVELWSRILTRMPGARLLLTYGGYENRSTQEHFIGLFKSHGVGPERLVFQRASYLELLSEYNHVDLALDTFPYSGGLTTCEALWMGVPVVTLPGDTFAGRHSLSHLSNVGVPQFVAADANAYVEIAVSWARDLPQLAALRASLRQKMAASPLCDGPRFARNLEVALRDAWRGWCARQPRTSKPKVTAGKKQPRAAVRAALSESATTRYEHGVRLDATGDRTGAIAAYRRALEIEPNLTKAHMALGAVLLARGQAGEAEHHYRRAVDLEPANALAHNALGTALQDSGRHAAALASYRQAATLKPDLAVVAYHLGNALMALGQVDEGVREYQRALELAPDFVMAQSNLGTALIRQGKPAEAEEIFRRALKQGADHINLHTNLGTLLQTQGRLDEALGCYRRALELDPNSASTLNNLGNLLKSRGLIDEAEDCLRRAMELDPNYADALSNHLFFQHYHARATPASLAKSHALWEERFGRALRASHQVHTNERSPDRPLRLGFVSPDLGQHPVGWLIVKVIEGLRGHSCQTVCYSDRDQPDALTARIRAAAGEWRETHTLSQEALAELIRADGIDILFDLTGHTGRNRLLVFARKPAPVQVTWMGSEGTTGLSAMDYVIADRWEIPEEHEQHYIEQVYRMPEAYVCYEPPPFAPPVGPLAARERGSVTFGSFNNPAKVNPAVIATWAEIVERVPGSRLMLKYSGFDDPGTQKRFQDLFAGEGLDPARVEFSGWSPHEACLHLYNTVDIGLDPFPFSGSLTTCEALWMGVPVITWPGETFASRHSLGHLSNLELQELIAHSRQNYLDIAVDLARDLPRLAAMRAGLRDRMIRSPLCDGPRFCEHLMAATRTMWKRFCKSAPPLPRHDPKPVTAEHASLADVHRIRGSGFRRAGKLQEALECYHQALELEPRSARALNGLGMVLRQLGRGAEAVESYRQALALEPGFVDALYNLGNVLLETGKPQEAADSYRRVLALTPEAAGAHNNLGTAMRALGQLEEAIQCHQEALRHQPEFVDALYNLGNALKDRHEPVEALRHYLRAIELKPDFAEALNNAGVVLLTLHRPKETLANCERALSFRPQYADALNNCGNAQMALGRLEEALASYDQVLRLDPGYTDAWANRGHVLVALKRPEEALASFDAALARDADQPGTFGAMLNSALHSCLWDRVSAALPEVPARIAGSGAPMQPFVLVASSDDPALQLECARRFVQATTSVSAPAQAARPPAPGKLRIAYLSADFSVHATAFLMAELFERHDRAGHEIIGISMGGDDGSPMRQRLVRAFDHFEDVGTLSDADVAQRIRELGIHILVDLKGHTRDSRAGILARRAAPIQVSYLGYPGTTGAGFIDYVMADAVVLPAAEQPHFSERIVHLPDSYQVSSSRPEPAATPTRSACGLPPEGFVFCCFNYNYKITAPVFDVWARLLAGTPGSVLWLLGDNEDAKRNLRREAEQRGIDPGRLIFANRVSPEQHLARHALADLFLDTVPCNAHTTASDALWCGLPLLTCTGKTFASRVAASVLTAAGLPELITRNLADYEKRAMELSRDLPRLAEIKRRLGENRATCALFNVERFARHLEAAFGKMWELHESRRAPHGFSVGPIA